MTKGNTTRRRRLAAAIAVIGAGIGALTLAPSAFGLGFTGLSTTPATTQAGANADFTIHVGFTSPGDDVQDIRIGLPPGQIGNPQIAPKCTQAQFDGGACPANTRVGSVSTSVSAFGLLPLTVNGSLFNFNPQPGEPARFAIILNPAGALLPLGQIKLQSAVELRQSDLGLDTVIEDIPNTAAGAIPIDITAMDVTLEGDTPTFSRNATSCTTKTTNFAANSYASPGTTVTGQASYTPTNCAGVPFSPEFSAKAGSLGQTSPGGIPPVTTAIDQTIEEAGLKTAVVQTPIDFTPNLPQLNESCPPADFQTGNCAPGTVIGTAVATSPLLTQPLTGTVFLITNPVSLPDIGLDLQGELALKLMGTLAPGNIVTFDGLPDIPISHFELRFNGAPDGLLAAAKDLCQPPAPNFTGSFIAHSGTSLPFAAAATIEGCGGGAAGPAPGNKCVKKKVKRKKKSAAKSEATAAKKKKRRKACGKKKRKKK
jgi:hypothetical protein